MAEPEEENLDALLGDDGFITGEQREEAEAARRRAQRKERLARLSEKMKAEKQEEIIAPPVTGVAGRREERGDSNILERDDGNDASPAEDETKAQEDEDDFDMFSGSVSPPTPEDSKLTQGQQKGKVDEDGYYKAALGEIITLARIQFRVTAVVGKGVFSTVLQCAVQSNATAHALPAQVALKCIRRNDRMAQAAVQELRILQKLRSSTGVVPLLLPTEANTVLEHEKHVVLVFEYRPFNLRDLVSKFGKGVGLSLQAVRSYAGQLLAALLHLHKNKIIHADIKPDNVLVAQDYGVVQLADFGSAVDVMQEGEIAVTPYLVSRFYRAPEIILGLPPSYGIDLWSLAVSLAEVFTGKVLFPGSSNNDMLFVMQNVLGNMFPNRVIRQHISQVNKHPDTVEPHFSKGGSGTYQFLQMTVDSVSGHAIQKPIPQFQPSSNSIKKTFHKASPDSPKLQINNWVDLIEKCLMIEPSKRIALKDALQHDFFKTT